MSIATVLPCLITSTACWRSCGILIQRAMSFAVPSGRMPNGRLLSAIWVITPPINPSPPAAIARLIPRCFQSEPCRGNPSNCVIGRTSAISILACFSDFSASGNCADLPECGLWITIAVCLLGKFVHLCMFMRICMISHRPHTNIHLPNTPDQLVYRSVTHQLAVSFDEPRKR